MGTIPVFAGTCFSEKPSLNTSDESLVRLDRNEARAILLHFTLHRAYAFIVLARGAGQANIATIEPSMHWISAMSPAFIEFVGSGAAVLTTASFFPQAIKTLKDKNTSGLSLSMYLMLVTGVALWLSYGILIGSWPLILANGVSILPQLVILALMLKESWYSRRRVPRLTTLSNQAES